MQGIIELSWSQLAWFSLILLIPLFISRKYRLDIGRETCFALLRMTLQLIFMGLYLTLLFEQQNPWLNGIWLSIMVLIGASAIVDKNHIPKQLFLLPVLLGLLVGLLPILLLMLWLLVQPQPWYDAQYWIPIAGMLLGNSLNGNIIALQQLVQALVQRQDEYQAALALGASPKQAIQPFIQQALTKATAPLLATIATTGLVSLPGMMTGQILSGADPMLAIKYQIVIMLAILVMVNIATAVTMALSTRTMFTQNGRLRFNLPSQ